MKKKQHTEQWFINRIGKKIYRLTPFECCKACDSAYDNGIVVANENHAYYIYINQNELQLEYGDKK